MVLAVEEALIDWELQDKVVTVSYDTTRRNLFEVQLGKDLL